MLKLFNFEISKNSNYPDSNFLDLTVLITNHCLRKADQCANKVRRDLMHKERSVSRNIDTDCNMGLGKGEGCSGQAQYTLSQ